MWNRHRTLTPLRNIDGICSLPPKRPTDDAPTQLDLMCNPGVDPLSVGAHFQQRHNAGVDFRRAPATTAAPATTIAGTAITAAGRASASASAPAAGN
jgi:hypothetical protein